MNLRGVRYADVPGFLYATGEIVRDLVPHRRAKHHQGDDMVETWQLRVAFAYSGKR